jgi:hypothetical protein
MKGQAFIVLSLAFVLLAPLATALSYTPTTTISGFDYTVKRYALADGKEHVYSITPQPNSLITVSVKGSGGYEAWVDLFDPVTEKFIKQYHPGGSEATFTYTAGGSASKSATYYLVVNGKGTGEYVITYAERSQNDAEGEKDAPAEFLNGIPLKLGLFEGYMGDNDIQDSYLFKAVNGETLTFTLTNKEKSALRFVLVDDSMFTKVDKNAMLEPGQSLLATYASTRDQDLYLTVYGANPYTFAITSDKREAAAEPEETLPPPPPPPPPVVTEPEEEEEVIAPSTNMTPFFIAGGILVVLLAVGTFFLIRKKQDAVVTKTKAPAKEK